MGAELLEKADEVLAEWGGHISTHYAGCWKRHVACFAVLVKDVLSEQKQAQGVGICLPNGEVDVSMSKHRGGKTESGA